MTTELYPDDLLIGYWGDCDLPVYAYAIIYPHSSGRTALLDSRLHIEDEGVSKVHHTLNSANQIRFGDIKLLDKYSKGTILESKAFIKSLLLPGPGNSKDKSTVDDENHEGTFASLPAC